MLMNTMQRLRRPVLGTLLPFLLALLLHTPATAGTLEDAPQGTNVKWTVKDDVIVINYDLKTDPELKFSVDIVMKRDNDPSFEAEPVTVEGDIGEGYFSGTNREIRWYYRRDFPQGFEGEGYYFEIHVKQLAKQDPKVVANVLRGWVNPDE